MIVAFCLGMLLSPYVKEVREIAEHGAYMAYWTYTILVKRLCSSRKRKVSIIAECDKVFGNTAEDSADDAAEDEITQVTALDSDSSEDCVSKESTDKLPSLETIPEVSDNTVDTSSLASYEVPQELTNLITECAKNACPGVPLNSCWACVKETSTCSCLVGEPDKELYKDL